MGLEIRPLTVADIPVADAILMPAFQRDTSYAPELARYLRLQAEGWYLAALNGQPAGTIGAFDYGPFAWLGLMAVAPHLQGRGIAKALVAELLAWLDARECPLVLLDASAAGAPLYPRFGFEDRDEVVAFTRTSTGESTMRPSGPVAVLQPADLPAAAAFDRPVFGADRQAVLDMFVRDNPGRALIIHDTDGRIGGYLIAQPRRLGPWVASSDAAAAALLRAALALPFEGPLDVLVPAANVAGAALLARHGFSPQRRLRHMARGSGLHAAQRMHIYGQASFTLG